MSDYLSEEEQLERLKSWWSTNGTSLLTGLALAVAGLVGWRWYDHSTTEARESASDLYETFLAAEGDGRAALAEQLDQNIEGSAYQAFTLLHRAREAVEADSIEAAVAYLQRVIDADSPSSLQDLARVRLARLHQQGGDGAAALAVLAGVRGSGYRGLAQELKGDIHVEQGERALAHEAYRSARQEMGDDRNRPILDIKINDTAPPEQPEPQSAEPEPEIAEPEPQPQPESAEAVPE
ncbi:MAG: tetratricopeptide repeat protein [Gammaproteobacteria bacterium]|nr:tetratricopeptide repeat protein [Gammaproteobacteria bacterium]MYH15703.1 tetratricopeptide repeat protein [Gammaproteobacteria bacterium]MYK84571.1 tetratricopeptide repeat protein [Gammaproteobacteria bacterium]